VPVIGYLYGGVPEAGANHTAAFHKGLIEAGYVEGRNVTDRLPLGPQQQ
jgi:hypothetical protein